MSFLNDVLEPLRRLRNIPLPRDQPSTSVEELIFSDNNQSLSEDIPNQGQGMSSIGTMATCLPRKRLRTELNPTSASELPSPTEVKKLKIDLIAAKAKVTRLEHHINYQYAIHGEMKILLEEKNSSLTDQHQRDERAVSDMKERLEIIRKTEQALRHELYEAQNEHRRDKMDWDFEKQSLHKQMADLQDKLFDNDISSKNQLAEMKKDLDRKSLALDAAQSEIEILKAEVAKQTSKAKQCVPLQNQLDRKEFELMQAYKKVRVLEFEAENYKDWRQQVARRGSV